MLAIILWVVIPVIIVLTLTYGNWPKHYEPEEILPLDEHEKNIS